MKTSKLKKTQSIIVGTELCFVKKILSDTRFVAVNRHGQELDLHTAQENIWYSNDEGSIFQDGFGNRPMGVSEMQIDEDSIPVGNEKRELFLIHIGMREMTDVEINEMHKLMEYTSERDERILRPILNISNSMNESKKS